MPEQRRYETASVGLDLRGFNEGYSEQTETCFLELIDGACHFFYGKGSGQCRPRSLPAVVEGAVLHERIASSGRMGVAELQSPVSVMS